MFFLEQTYLACLRQQNKLRQYVLQNTLWLNIRIALIASIIVSIAIPITWLQAQEANENDNIYNDEDYYYENTNDTSQRGSSSNAQANTSSKSIAPPPPEIPEFDGTATVESNPYSTDNTYTNNNVSIIPQNSYSSGGYTNPTTYSNEVPLVTESSPSPEAESLKAQEQPIAKTKAAKPHSSSTPPSALPHALPEQEDLPKMRLKSIPLPNEFSGKPPVPGTLGVLEVGDAPAHYTVNEGDTLFDICDQLLSEPGYWPKLWALNPEIRNPHYIWPGMVLRFYPGNDSLPPFLEIQDDIHLTPVAVEQDYIVEDLLVADLPKEEEEIVRYLPSSFHFTEWDQITHLSGDQFEAEDPRVVKSMTARLPFFMYQSPPDPLGRVMGIFHATDATIQEGIIRHSQSMQIGQTYSVIRRGRIIYHPKKIAHRIGYLYHNVGVIKTTQKKAKQNNIAFTSKALWTTILPGDIIVELKTSQYRLPFTNRNSGQDSDATVVALEKDSSIASAGQFIVLDNTSLSMGSSVALYRLRSLANRPSYRQPFRYGTARVLNVSDGGTIAYVVYSDYAVRIGDRSDANF